MRPMNVDLQTRITHFMIFTKQCCVVQYFFVVYYSEANAMIMENNEFVINCCSCHLSFATIIFEDFVDFFSTGHECGSTNPIDPFPWYYLGNVVLFNIFFCIMSNRLVLFHCEAIGMHHALVVKKSASQRYWTIKGHTKTK